VQVLSKVADTTSYIGERAAYSHQSHAVKQCIYTIFFRMLFSDNAHIIPKAVQYYNSGDHFLCKLARCIASHS